MGAARAVDDSDRFAETVDGVVDIQEFVVDSSGRRIHHHCGHGLRSRLPEFGGGGLGAFLSHLSQFFLGSLQVRSPQIVGIGDDPQTAAKAAGTGVNPLTKTIVCSGEFRNSGDVTGSHDTSIGEISQNSSGTGTVAYVFSERVERVRAAMRSKDVDAVLLSVGPDLPWLTGFGAHPMERLTMLVLPVDGAPTLVLPGFEIDGVVDSEQIMTLAPWGETDDPIDLVGQALGGATKGRLAIGDHTWSRFLVGLQRRFAQAQWTTAGSVLGPLRATKDAAEVEALARAGSGVDKIAGELQRGEIPVIGRTELEVAADIRRRIVEEGHAKVNFCIVASGPNSASPHHDTGSRVIQPNEPILFDFGGTTAEPPGQPGYCSDTTRMLFTGEPPAEYREAYDALFQAQEAGFNAAQVGTGAQDVDDAARSLLTDAGLGHYFLHRLGHGIGVEAHEDPYLVGGNAEPLLAGNAFSIEPGFYISDKWGARIEDIVVATDDGPRRLNNSSRELAIVDR